MEGWREGRRVEVGGRRAVGDGGSPLRKQNLGCVRVVMCHSDREPVHMRARRRATNDGGRPGTQDVNRNKPGQGNAPQRHEGQKRSEDNEPT